MTDGAPFLEYVASCARDRVYRAGGEAEQERVLTWPLSTGLNLGWQATPFQKATRG